MPNSLEELLSTPIPSKLWHYTTMQGFKGIIGSKEIWATDVRFTNDATEFTHGLQVANDAVNNTSEQGKLFFPARVYAKKAAEIGFQNEFLELLQFFVASFSVAEDQLSQWRGYSSNGTGVSVAFDLSAARPPAGLGTLVCFAPCVYEQDKKACLLNDCLARFVSTAEKHWCHASEKLPSSDDLLSMADREKALAAARVAVDNPNFKKEISIAAREMRGDLIRVAALCKHAGFYEEREWRLVLPIEKSRCDLKNPPRFRAAGDKQIPYIAYPLPQPLPVADVMLGPCCNENAVNQVRGFLQSHEINVEPRLSTIPYRPV